LCNFTSRSNFIPTHPEKLRQADLDIADAYERPPRQRRRLDDRPALARAAECGLNGRRFGRTNGRQ
jgi:hypothetical protein